LAVRYVVQKSRPSSNFGVRGQGHKGQKRKIEAFFREQSSGPCVRCVFEKTSLAWRSEVGVFSGACVICQFYAGGKISACCLV